MPLVQYVLLVKVGSTEHPADLIEHVRAALEGAAGISTVDEISPIVAGAGKPLPTLTPPPFKPKHESHTETFHKKVEKPKEPATREHGKTSA